MKARLQWFGALTVAVFLASACDEKAPAAPRTEQTATIALSATSTQATTAVPAPTAAPPPAPAPLRSVPVHELGYGPAQSLPGGLVVYYRAAHYQSDGPPNTLFRAYLDAGGNNQIVDLFAAFGARSSTNIGPYTVAADERMEEIVVAVCRGQSCGVGVRNRSEGSAFLACACGELPQGAMDGEVYRSVDGGVTWRREGELPFGGQFVGWTRAGPVVSFITFPAPGGFVVRYETWPGKSPVAPPLPGLAPYENALGRLTWARPGDETSPVYDEDGRILFTPTKDIALGGFQRVSTASARATFEVVRSLGHEYYLLKTKADGQPLEAWRLPEGGWLYDITAVDGTRFLGTTEVPGNGYQTVLVDLAAGPAPAAACARRRDRPHLRQWAICGARQEHRRCGSPGDGLMPEPARATRAGRSRSRLLRGWCAPRCHGRSYWRVAAGGGARREPRLGLEPIRAPLNGELRRPISLAQP